MSNADESTRLIALNRLRDAFDECIPELKALIGSENKNQGVIKVFTDNIVIAHPIIPSVASDAEVAIGSLVTALAYFRLTWLFVVSFFAAELVSVHVISTTISFSVQQSPMLTMLNSTFA